jgi:hypothetical protein
MPELMPLRSEVRNVCHQGVWEAAAVLEGVDVVEGFEAVLPGVVPGAADPGVLPAAGVALEAVVPVPVLVLAGEVPLGFVAEPAPVVPAVVPDVPSTLPMLPARPEVREGLDEPDALDAEAIPEALEVAATPDALEVAAIWDFWSLSISACCWASLASKATSSVAWSFWRSATSCLRLATCPWRDETWTSTSSWTFEGSVVDETLSACTGWPRRPPPFRIGSSSARRGELSATAMRNASPKIFFRP